MSMLPTYKHILYASDLGQYTRPVFRQAIAMALSTGAKITMLHVVEPLGNTGRAVIGAYLPNMDMQALEHEALQEVLSRMHQRLAKYCKEERDNVQVEASIVEALEVANGTPSEEIVKAAESRHADLIVMGASTHPMHGERLAVGSTARKVLHHSQIPVLLVPNTAHR